MEKWPPAHERRAACPAALTQKLRKGAAAEIGRRPCAGDRRALLAAHRLAPALPHPRQRVRPRDLVHDLGAAEHLRAAVARVQGRLPTLAGGGGGGDVTRHTINVTLSPHVHARSLSTLRSHSLTLSLLALPVAAGWPDVAIATDGSPALIRITKWKNFESCSPRPYDRTGTMPTAGRQVGSHAGQAQRHSVNAAPLAA